MEKITQRVEKIDADAAETIVVANNHYLGKEMKLAVQLLAWHRQQRVKVPELLLRTYPSLKQIALGQGELFA